MALGQRACAETEFSRQLQLQSHGLRHCSLVVKCAQGPYGELLSRGTGVNECDDMIASRLMFWTVPLMSDGGTVSLCGRGFPYCLVSFLTGKSYW